MRWLLGRCKGYTGSHTERTRRACARPRPEQGAFMKNKQVKFLKQLLETPSATGTEIAVAELVLSLIHI